MQQMTIAIQGGRASFHDMAAQHYFASAAIQLLACRTFREVCDALVDGRCDTAVMAIENSLVGSILPNYSLLQQYPLFIAGELYLHIEQHLMALPGQQLADIRAVRSHPMALHQCDEFLQRHPQLRGIEADDTAESARQIAENGIRGEAAIASRLAAERYGLEILAEGIENLRQNYTRFLVLSTKAPEVSAAGNKASINFHVHHEPGALVKVLTAFHFNNINLSLIQSIPVAGKPNEYAFHVDLEWENSTLFRQAMHHIREFAIGLQILGIYRKGRLPHPAAATGIAGEVAS